jgi:hypothetical protein
MLTLTKERVPRERSHDVSYIAFDLERRVHVVQVEMAAIVTVETVARDVATSSYGKRSGLTVATCVALWNNLGALIASSLASGRVRPPPPNLPSPHHAGLQNPPTDTGGTGVV